jgi:hypothetical protein
LGKQSISSFFICACFSYFQDGLTPLLISSKEGNLDVIKSLMSRQARLDAFDQVREEIKSKMGRTN